MNPIALNNYVDKEMTSICKTNLLNSFIKQFDTQLENNNIDSIKYRMSTLVNPYCVKYLQQEYVIQEIKSELSKRYLSQGYHCDVNIDSIKVFKFVNKN